MLRSIPWLLRLLSRSHCWSRAGLGAAAQRWPRGPSAGRPRGRSPHQQPSGQSGRTTTKKEEIWLAEPRASRGGSCKNNRGGKPSHLCCFPERKEAKPLRRTVCSVFQSLLCYQELLLPNYRAQRGAGDLFSVLTGWAQWLCPFGHIGDEP